jgi:hypothetical protein
LTPSGPASIIYNEGGQRAEEDDLDDEEPAASAYVSRAPSPPALESQLHIPERSYLEVPNATTSVRSGKSRGSPPDSEGVDKGKAPQDATSGSTPSRSMSVSRNIPAGIELPGPIALTDSNSSRRSGSGRLGETLTSIWGNTLPSAGQSANSSVLPSPLEGPSSRSALVNALKPLASVPEGSAIPEVVHAEPQHAGAGGVPEVYRASPPKTPKAETPYANASPSRTHGSTSAAAISPKSKGTPKAASKAPSAAGSARPGGTPRGLSIYSNVAQLPPGVATPKGPVSGSISPARNAHSAETPPEQPTEPEAAQTEPPTTSTPKAATRAPSPKPPSPIPPPESIEPLTTEPAAIQPDPALDALAPPPSEPPAVPAPAEPLVEPAAAVEEEDSFGWGQTKSKAGSRKSSKAGSKAASKGGSKAASKVPTPKGTETPKPEPTFEEAGAGISAGSPTVERPKPPSGPQSPLATVPEDHPAEPVAGALPGGYFITNPDETQDPPPSDPPAQTEFTSLSGFGNALGGSMSQNLFGAVTSGFGWGKSKPTTPKASTPTWGGLGVSAPSVAESTGGGGGGWGAATGNNNGSNSMWGSITGGKSGNASAADLLDSVGTADHSAQDTVQNDESLSFIPLDGAPAAESYTEEGGLWQEGPGSQEPLTVETNLAGEPGADTAGPTTAAADSPEVEIREGDGGGGEEETGEKQPEEEEWALPVKAAKKKKGASAGTATPMPKAGGAGGDDDWMTGGGAKKKKGKKR